MRFVFTPHRRDGHRIAPRHLVWMIPLGLVAGAGLFIAVGFLVAWLWKVTVVDIFAIKPISFWQAWGIILLAQILFKANMTTNTRGRRRRRHAGGGWRRRRHAGGGSPEMEPGQPLPPS